MNSWHRKRNSGEISTICEGHGCVVFLERYSATLLRYCASRLVIAVQTVPSTLQLSGNATSGETLTQSSMSALGYELLRGID